MNQATATTVSSERRWPGVISPSVPFAAVLCLTGLVAGLAPVGVSIIAVALFAGPHNFVEFGYFLRKMPARWGRLRGYFVLGISGTLLLSASHVLLTTSPLAGRTATAAWSSALVLWILWLAALRQRQNPRRDWPWLASFGWLLIAAAWLWPYVWVQSLVFVHPLVTFWFLDRQLARQKAAGLANYRRALGFVPVLLILIAIFQSGDTSESAPTGISAALASHAGANVFTAVPGDVLIALHAFLELSHYIIWLALIPIAAGQTAVPRVEQIPLARSPWFGQRGVQIWFWGAALLVACLWIGFPLDYLLTRQIYFTFAIVHVLAEVPFLLREL